MRRVLIVATVAVLLGGCDAVVGTQCRAGWALCHGVCATACDSDGGAADSGTGFDSGVERDSSTLVDSSSGLDSGAVLDSGSDSDAAAVLDAGDPDAAPLCTPPLVDCAGECVDLTTDPDHCGSCPNYCGTGLCVDSTCVSGFPGHVVLVGHDYTRSRSATQRVIGNAVFLARTSPVQVLVWEGTSTFAARTGTDAAISATATVLGRTWTRTAATTMDEVPAMLPAADVLLVYAQAGSTDAELAALGSAWSAALGTFLDRGGVVVLTDTAAPSNLGTYELLQSAGLVSCTGVTDVSLSTLNVHAAADALALGVPLTYRAERNTVRFATTDGSDVVGDDTGPVVVHLVVTP